MIVSDPSRMYALAVERGDGEADRAAASERAERAGPAVVGSDRREPLDAIPSRLEHVARHAAEGIEHPRAAHLRRVCRAAARAWRMKLKVTIAPPISTNRTSAISTGGQSLSDAGCAPKSRGTVRL